MSPCLKTEIKIDLESRIKIELNKRTVGHLLKYKLSNNYLFSYNMSSKLKLFQQKSAKTMNKFLTPALFQIVLIDLSLSSCGSFLRVSARVFRLRSFKLQLSSRACNTKHVVDLNNWSSWEFKPSGKSSNHTVLSLRHGENQTRQLFKQAKAQKKVVGHLQFKVWWNRPKQWNQVVTMLQSARSLQLLENFGM